MFKSLYGYLKPPLHIPESAGSRFTTTNRPTFWVFGYTVQEEPRWSYEFPVVLTPNHHESPPTQHDLTTNLPRTCQDFDFIECFTTTFLRAHSWLNWVDEDDDEDEVGLKEKPEDTRYIKKITSK